MKLAWIVIGSGCLFSACGTSDTPRLRDPWSAAPPKQQLIDEIELRLSNDACVGDIKRWARFYEWSFTQDGIDTSTVEIHLREAGAFGFGSGRQIRARDPSLSTGQIRITADDRKYLVAFASYHVPTKQLDLRSCGLNRN